MATNDTIRLTKQFSFEAAHALEGYDGLCSEIHGHSYRLDVTVAGVPSSDDNDPKCGMVVDFGVLKQIVTEQIVSRLDHSLILQRTERSAPLIETLQSYFSRIVVMDYRPTCENMLADFASRLTAALPQGIRLCALRLHETATSYAEWVADDNKR